MKSDALRPVVALDMDGVLRIPPPESDNLEAVEHVIAMRRGAYPELFHSSPPWDQAGTYTDTHVFSRHAVNWVHGLLDRGIDVRWATTWGDHANTYLAGPLQLPLIPVIPGVATIPYDTSGKWKARSIAADTRGRPVIWVDDQPVEEVLRRRHSPRALTATRRINGATGLTPADSEAVDAWLELASSEEGQQELRRAWRRELDRRRRNPPNDPEFPYYAFV